MLSRSGSGRAAASGGARVLFDARWDVVRFDPDVPVVQVGPELCAAVQRAVGFREDEP